VPDPRLTTLADLLCRYSLEVSPDDLVLVTGPALAQPLMLELVKAITDAGAHPMVRPSLESVDALLVELGTRAQLEAVTKLDELEIDLPNNHLTIWANGNTRYLSSAPSENITIRTAAFRGLFERYLKRTASGDARWCGTCFPSHAAAQEAGMSLPDWQDFVFGAGHLGDPDPIAYWKRQSARQAEIAERLSQVSELRMVADGTDLTLRVEGRTWLNADGRENFPDGEVYTSPVETATSGHVSFSFDATYHGRDVSGVKLWFEDGKVVREEAARGEGYLRSLLDQDAGARYLGEVAFGLNDEIQTATRDTLFDEKIGGTFHVALGMAFPEAGGTNSSGLHWDLVCDLRDGGEVYGDGELLARDGKFLT
jgi:aminopeptidase